MRWSASFLVILLVSSTALFGEYVRCVPLLMPWLCGCSKHNRGMKTGARNHGYMAYCSPYTHPCGDYLSKPPLNSTCRLAGWTVLVRDLSIATQFFFLSMYDIVNEKIIKFDIIIYS